MPIVGFGGRGSFVPRTNRAAASFAGSGHFLPLSNSPSTLALRGVGAFAPKSLRTAYDSTALLDQVNRSRGQHEVVFNGVLNAISEAALFGVKVRATQGLDFTMYGGNFPSSGTYVAVPETTVKLTPSTTNYIYVTDGGVITKVTSAPTGWPGPLASSARALYQLVVGADSITSGTNYCEGPGQPGAQGPQGNAGPVGDELWLQRRRIISYPGFSASRTAGGSPGYEDVVTVGGGGGGVSNAPDSSTFFGAWAHQDMNPGTSIANSSGGVRSTNNLHTLGNAAKRGGFDITFVFGINTTNAHNRCFFGLFDVSGGDPSGSVDPSALLNIIGVGGDDGDANLQFMVNDGSGAATKTNLGTNFPQRSPGTSRVNELRLWCTANASVVNYTLTDAETGNIATGSASTNLPAGTTFLGFLAYCNTGAGGASSFGFSKIAGNSRY